MSMELDHTGAEMDDELKRHAEDKKAKFDKVRQDISDANIKPLNYHEFLRVAREIAERNRKEKEGTAK